MRVNIVAVSRRLGHSDVNMTLKCYAHLMKKSEDKMIETLTKSSQIIKKHYFIREIYTRGGR